MPKQIMIPILMFLIRITKCVDICDSYGICDKCALEFEVAALKNIDFPTARTTPT